MDPKGKMDPKAPGHMADPNTCGPMPKIPAMLLSHVSAPPHPIGTFRPHYWPQVPAMRLEAFPFV